MTNSKDKWRNRLRAQLDARKVSYAEASRAIDKHRQYVSNLWNSDADPGIDSILRICDIYSINPILVFADSKDAEQMQSAFETLNSMTEEEAQLLKGLLENISPIAQD